MKCLPCDSEGVGWVTEKCLEDIHRVVILAMRLRYSYPSTIVDSGDAAVSTVIQIPVPTYLHFVGYTCVNQ